MRLITRLLLGVDVSLGIISYIICSWLMNQKFNFPILVWSIVFTHWPDLDLIPFLLLRRRFRLGSHWVIGHHPVILLPIAGLIGFYAGQVWEYNSAYLATLSGTSTLLHLLHDGQNSKGFHWLSPFCWIRLRFFSLGKSFIVSKEEVRKYNEYKGISAGAEITERIKPIDIPVMALFVTALIALSLFALT